MNRFNVKWRIILIVLFFCILFLMYSRYNYLQRSKNNLKLTIWKSFQFKLFNLIELSAKILMSNTKIKQPSNLRKLLLFYVYIFWKSNWEFNSQMCPFFFYKNHCGCSWWFTHTHKFQEYSVNFFMKLFGLLWDTDDLKICRSPYTWIHFYFF